MANRTKKTPFSAASVVLLALMIALVIVALSLLPPDALSTFLVRLFSGSRDEPLSPEQQAYETIFANMTLPETAAPAPIDTLSLIEAFSQFAFAGEYRHLYTVRYTDGRQTLERTISLDRKNERYTAAIYNGDTQSSADRLQTIRYNGEVVEVEDALGNARTYPPSDDFNLFSAIYQPDPDALCARLAVDPPPDAHAEIAASEYGRILTLTLTEPTLTRTYLYLLDYGILYSASAVQGDLVYYNLVTKGFSMGEEVAE